MGLRVMEVILPEKHSVGLLSLLEKCDTLGVWREELDHGNIMVRILVPSGLTEAVTDKITANYSGVEGFRVMIFSLEATIPSPEAPPEKPADETAAAADAETAKLKLRISREELLEDVTQGLLPQTIYILTIVLSSLVAAIGLIRSDVVIIIGAMVIAPFLGPNVALALGATLGDPGLILKSLKSLVIGILVALVTAFIIGYTLEIDPTTPAIISRTALGIGDIGLALAAGVVGALAYTTGVSTALIGVMVAAALLPPLVNTGILVGAGEWHMALGAFLLFITNIICLNLAGVMTFLAQGIRPRTWWEAEKARRATVIALSFWAIALIILLLIILFWWKN